MRIWLSHFQDILRYTLLSSGTANSIKALDYFYIIEQTGIIYLRKPLTDDLQRENRFTVGSAVAGKYV